MNSGLGALSDISLAEQAKERIRTAILEGVIKPEQRITIEQIAADLGISRTPVREALKALEADGLVRLIPRRGAVVETIAQEELITRYEVRAMLESYAAAKSCAANGVEIGQLLSRNCDRLAALINKASTNVDQIRAMGELNHEFHKLIRDGSRSPTIIRLLESFRNPMSFTVYYWSAEERQIASLKIHREIADAFLAQKPELARNLMERHLLEARDELIKMGRGTGEQTATRSVRRLVD